MKRYFVVVVVALASLFLFWLPFLLKTGTFWGINFGRHGMETIVTNFDGLNYLAVAKTLYDPQLLGPDFAGFGNSPIYYAAHFPVYPLLIRTLDLVVSGPQALLWATIISNILLTVGLYAFFQTLIKDKKMATTMAIIALFFPARMLSVRGVGSSEPLFMFFVLTSLVLAYKGKHWMASILGSLAVLTRSPGILLFGAYLVAAIGCYHTDWKKMIARLSPYLLMPAALALLFGFYGQRYGSIWAYFNSSSELHPFFFPPLLIFSNMQRWITDMWREDIIYMYVMYGVGIYLYGKKFGIKGGFAQLATAGFGVLYGVFLLMIAHRDLARYALPIAPVALLGFAPLFEHKSAKWLILMLIPIFLVGWQFIVANVQPIADWGALL